MPRGGFPFGKVISSSLNMRVLPNPIDIFLVKMSSFTGRNRVSTTHIVLNVPSV